MTLAMNKRDRGCHLKSRTSSFPRKRESDPADSSFPRKRESNPADSSFPRKLKRPSVYILASKPNGTLYVGVTSNLKKRVYEHRNDIIDGFTRKYQVHLLVYYESHNDMKEAILREKRMKKWNRSWKIELIEGMNPNWNDLWDEL